MTYVGVKHKPSNSHLWWFCVPESLKENIELGATAICDTRKGKRSGEIIEIRDGISEQEATQLSNGSYIRSIIGVKTEVRLADIIIPNRFKNSRPKEAKIMDRLREFCANGMFGTAIEVNKRNILTNGYTAYIAAKRMGRKTLDCLKIA